MVVSNSHSDKTVRRSHDSTIEKSATIKPSSEIRYRPLSCSRNLLKELNSLGKIGQDILKDIKKIEQVDGMQSDPLRGNFKKSQLKKIKVCVENLFKFIKTQLRPFLGMGKDEREAQTVSDLKDLVSELKWRRPYDFSKRPEKEHNSFSRQEDVAYRTGALEFRKGFQTVIGQIQKLANNFKTRRESCHPLDYKAQAQFDKRFKTAQKLLNAVEKRLISYDASLQRVFQRSTGIEMGKLKSENKKT